MMDNNNNNNNKNKSAVSLLFAHRAPRSVVPLRLARAQEHQEAVAASRLSLERAQAVPGSDHYHGGHGRGGRQGQSGGGGVAELFADCGSLVFPPEVLQQIRPSYGHSSAGEGAGAGTASPSQRVLDVSALVAFAAVSAARICERLEELVRCFVPRSLFLIDCSFAAQLGHLAALQLEYKAFRVVGLGAQQQHTGEESLLMNWARGVAESVQKAVAEFVAVRVAQGAAALAAAEAAGEQATATTTPHWWGEPVVVLTKDRGLATPTAVAPALATDDALRILRWRQGVQHQASSARHRGGGHRPQQRHNSAAGGDHPESVVVWVSQDELAFASALAAQEPMLYLFRWCDGMGLGVNPPRADEEPPAHFGDGGDGDGSVDAEATLQAGEVWQIHVLRQYAYREMNTVIARAVPMAPDIGQRHLLCDYALLLTLCLQSGSAIPSCRLVPLPGGMMCDGSGFDSLLEAYGRYLEDEFEGKSMEKTMYRMTREDILGNERAFEGSDSESDEDNDANIGAPRGGGHTHCLVEDTRTGRLSRVNVLRFFGAFAETEVSLMVRRWKMQHKVSKSNEAQSLLSQIVVSTDNAQKDSESLRDRSMRLREQMQLEEEADDGTLSGFGVVDVANKNWRLEHYGTGGAATNTANLNPVVEHSANIMLARLENTARLLVSGAANALSPIATTGPSFVVSPFIADVMERRELCSSWARAAEAQQSNFAVLDGALLLLPDPGRNPGRLQHDHGWVISHVQGHGSVDEAVPLLHPGVRAAIDFSFAKTGWLVGLQEILWHPQRYMEEPALPTPTPYELESDAAAYADKILRASEGSVATADSSSMWANALTAKQTIGYQILQRMGWDGGRIGQRSYDAHSDFVDEAAALAPVAAELMMEAMKSGMVQDTPSFGRHSGGPQRPGGLGWESGDADLRQSAEGKAGGKLQEVEMSAAARKRIEHAQRHMAPEEKRTDFKQKEVSFVSKKELHGLLLNFIEKQAQSEEGVERADMVFPPTLTNVQRKMVHQEVRGYKCLGSKSVGVEPNRCIHVVYKTETRAAVDKAARMQAEAEKQAAAARRRAEREAIATGTQPSHPEQQPPQQQHQAHSPAASLSSGGTHSFLDRSSLSGSGASSFVAGAASAAPPPKAAVGKDVPLWMLASAGGAAGSRPGAAASLTEAGFASNAETNIQTNIQSAPPFVQQEPEGPPETVPTWNDWRCLQHNYEKVYSRRGGGGGGYRRGGGNRGGNRRQQSDRGGNDRRGRGSANRSRGAGGRGQSGNQRNEFARRGGRGRGVRGGRGNSRG